MVLRTRLVNLILNLSGTLFNKSFSLDKFTRVLSLLLIGFLAGNLFGTFLGTIRKYTWDGVIVLFLLSLIEISNYNVYRSFLSVRFDKRPIVKRLFWKSVNFFKIGLMVGFFVDAFKVGS